MAKRTPVEVYATAVRAGFTPDQAVILTAIAGAESGYRNDALGDVSLEDRRWGPSYGLWQIRTLKADTGRGTHRDINALAAGDLAQARAAYTISKRGTDWTPWTVYRTGRYQAFLPAARSAAGTTVTAGLSGDTPLPGPWWLPWNLPYAAGEKVGEALGDAAGDVTGRVLGGARAIALEATAVVLGLTLVAGGVWALTRPGRRLVGQVAGDVGRVVR